MTGDGIHEYTDNAENRLIQVTGGGDADWFGQQTAYYYDTDAAWSGAIGANEETWMETTVEGPGDLTFRYKLSTGSSAGRITGTAIRGCSQYYPPSIALDSAAGVLCGQTPIGLG